MKVFSLLRRGTQACRLFFPSSRLLQNVQFLFSKTTDLASNYRINPIKINRNSCHNHTISMAFQESQISQRRRNARLRSRLRMPWCKYLRKPQPVSRACRRRSSRMVFLLQTSGPDNLTIKILSRCFSRLPRPKSLERGKQRGFSRISNCKTSW